MDVGKPPISGLGCRRARSSALLSAFHSLEEYRRFLSGSDRETYSGRSPQHGRSRAVTYEASSLLSRIIGVKVTPISNPSGERNRLTTWPHGSFLFFRSIL